jgi:peptidoglycan hydrolase CwlO-like protein
MKTNKKNQSSYRLQILSVMIISCLLFLLFNFVKADTVSDESQQKLEDLKDKAKIYRQIIEIKEKQGETLNNQLEITTTNIEQVQEQIKSSAQQIEDLNSQIIRLEKQIKEKDNQIEFKKKILANIIQTYYEANRTGVVAAYLSGGDVTSFIVNKDRIAQTGDKIQELVASIKEEKQDFETQSQTIDRKKSELVEKNLQFQNQKDKLASIKKQRENLLVQTQGEEARYRQLLANVEKQKQELLNIDQYFATSGLSADSYSKPDSKYFASTSWYFSQRDSRWGDENIGNTKTKMKNYGCAVTSVAMVFKEKGVSMTPGKLANEPIFSGDLINWYDSKDWEKSWPIPNSAYGWRHGNINWSVIDSKIEKGAYVIVYINRTKGGGHYVVIHHKDSKGKYVVHDPYFGANIFLDTSRALIGALGSSSSTRVDQMIIYE